MSEEPKELSPVQHIFDLREFSWPEFSAAASSPSAAKRAMRMEGPAVP